MSNAIVQISPAEEIGSGKKIIRAMLGGTFNSDDIKLLSAWAEGLNSAVKKISAGNEHTIGILIDISALETYTDANVITILSELMKKDSVYVYRTATFGGKDTHEMVEQIIEGLSNRDNLKNFNTENEALEWLKEQ